LRREREREEPRSGTGFFSNLSGMGLNAEYWDRHARKMRGPLFYEPIALYKRQEHLALVLAWAAVDAKIILKTDLFEEAYGKDSFLDALTERCSRVIGMDISPIVASEARNRVIGTFNLCNDVVKLALKGEVCDVVLSISTLDHLRADRVQGAVDELHRVLKPGGCLVLTLDNGHNVLHRVSNRITKWIGGSYAERCYTIGEIRHVLRERGFDVMQTAAIFHVPPGLNWAAKKAGNGTAIRRLVHFVIEKCRGLGALPTRFLTGRYIAVLAVRAAT
jgi:SAM-dependent methyltransferase